MIKYFAGIDPGWGGGMAVIKTEGPDIIAVRCYQSPSNKEKKKRKRILGIVKPWQSADIKFAIEKVGGWGNTDAFGTADMIRNHECWLFALDGLGIEYKEVVPQTWKSIYPKPPDMKALKYFTNQKEKNAERKRRKQHYENHALELFPGVEVFKWNADALLIAWFAFWTLGGLKDEIELRA